MRKKLLALATHRWVVTAFLSACIVAAIGHFSFGCNGWDPRRPFERNNPDVDRALEQIEDGQYENAEEVLTDYLETGVCKKDKINLPEDLRSKSDGTFDLGLVLFYLAEKYGERFGDEQKLLDKIDAGEDLGPLVEMAKKRDSEVKCALIVALGIAKDSKVPTELRARAFYLAGNLEFLRMDYARAIGSYEEALKLVPGVVEEAGGDGIGRDAAWNRAVALRRLEKMMEDAGADAGADGPGPQDPQDSGGGNQDQDGGDPNQPDGDKDGGNGADGGDAGEDAGDDGGMGDNADAGPDGGKQDGDGGDPQNQQPDAGDQDPNQNPQDPSDPQDADPQPADPSQSGPSSPDQGDRVLDRFDQTPTYQQEEAKKKNDPPKRNMEDK